MSDLTTDQDIIESIMRRALVCRIALADDSRPYIVPVCFGYEDGALYFHSSPQGRKMDILRKNNAVCFEFDIDQEVVKAEGACQWNIEYRSVIGFGKASLIEDPKEKRRALDLIVAQCGGEPEQYPQKTLSRTAVVRIDIESATAKVTADS
jgi:hypothetical protein